MEFLWKAPDGTTFPAERWEATALRRGTLIYVHGMGGAGAEFHHLAARAAEAGWEGFAINLRGQGLDPDRRRRGTELPLQALERDIAAFGHEMVGESTQPVIWCGESMGALILAHLLAKRPVPIVAHGAIFSAPVVRLRKPVPAAVRPLIRGIAALAPRLRLRPSLFVTGKSDGVRVSRDEEFRTRTRQSAHYIPVFSIGFLSALGDLIDRSESFAAKIETPSLVLVGNQDVYVTTEQVTRWFEALGASSKTLRTYPEAYHCLWNDFDRDLVVRDVLTWLGTQSVTENLVNKSL